MDKRRIGVRAIIYKDGKLLGVKHRSKSTGDPKDFWAIPGGGLDPGESLEDGLRREVYEELGVRVSPGRLLLIQQFTSTRQGIEEELEFFFLIENSQDFAAIDYSGTSHGLEELSACEFIDPQREFILPAILSTIDLRQLVETIQPVVVSTELKK